jgi:hypothetical protein
MPAIKYVIANQPFRTKGAIGDRVRRVRDATEIGEPINDPVVLALLQLHRDWVQKSSDMTSVSVMMIKGAAAAPWTKQIAILHGEAPFMDISWTGIVKALQPGGAVNLQTGSFGRTAESGSTFHRCPNSTADVARVSRRSRISVNIRATVV